MKWDAKRSSRQFCLSEIVSQWICCMLVLTTNELKPTSLFPYGVLFVRTQSGSNTHVHKDLESLRSPCEGTFFVSDRSLIRKDLQRRISKTVSPKLSLICLSLLPLCQK
jgi:hypothetical protein